jgi:hypothetical protein
VKPVSRERLLSTMRELEFTGRSGSRSDPDVGVATRTRPTDTDTDTDTGTDIEADGAGVDVAPTPADELLRINPEWMDHFPGFLVGQRDTVEAMAQALAAGKREDLHFLAHRASGGLATMGLDWAARQCREVEHKALEGEPDAIAQRISALRDHLAKVRIEAE